MNLIDLLARLNGSPPLPKAPSVDAADIRRLRAQLMLSQEGFAQRYGLALNTLRHWEQGLRRPDATARAYLTVISRDPRRVAAVFAGATHETLAQLTMRELTAALDDADREAAADGEENDGEELVGEEEGEAADATPARRSPAHSPAQDPAPPASPAAPAASRNPDR
jgi:putative transcriptional regulator